MAIVRDASSPARVLNSFSGGLQNWVTAAFNPPAASWLYLTLLGNPTTTGQTATFTTPTNTGTALTWAQIGNINNASGGAVVVWRAFNTSSQTGITVSGQISWSGLTSSASSAAWVDVWTGAATTQTSAAVATSTNTTQTSNPTVTTTAAGSQVAAAEVDWGATGAPTSSDTIDAYTVAGQTSGGRAYKTANSGAAGVVAVNLVNGGAAPINSIIIYEILAAAAVQLLAPSSDISAGTWAPSSGGSLFAMLNEAIANDATYDATSQTSTFKVGIAAGANPGVTTGHIVRYRIIGSQTVSLMQGATVVASWSQAPTVLTTFVQAVTSIQAATITDYTTLSLQFQAT